MKKSPSIPQLLNKNVQFIANPICWVFYAFLFFAVRVILAGMGISTAAAWTLVNFIHGAVSFSVFHWIKGTPFIDDHGAYSTQTFWEQIDESAMFDWARKFLTIFPIFLLYLALDSGKWELAVAWINLPVTALVLIPKLPFMHGVRIFGINS
ncbi:ORMDL family protein [Trichomonas vaginalis G3]|uniref:ORMDL family protein n=1 Tax=Trichomonas vaginalis (strain ATCC PRA-98 / G3) TaxID=412133 RepID=A2E9G6_TRIV3|nr:negative regulation of ceramide biosynthetic process [Trichomonas vaginalis G3]EAY10730.1 ORMDL family protein [Trichomonas vaginalis G3]KAI5538623.1 negative regulation of ceramide biosynthetic process [Trichomonas vaginalis G3]|eukprot:XP_001322953.1 ORMDL family protein [Trichomonas vaginalis G3]